LVWKFGFIGKQLISREASQRLSRGTE